ncbi:MAG: glycosyltransferase family 2 protein [Patescibacteria group bacterium]|nr:glycosyltransferase family 2 protein [Patescibacteria group bacterium]
MLYIFIFVGLYFQIFLLVTLLEKNNRFFEEKLGDKQRKWPTINITVPCFNEENTVTETILSLLNLDYPKDKLSFIVIDDGSTDNTFNVVKKLTEKYSQIKLIKKENGGKHTALNLGLRENNSELVAGLDADSFVDPQALKRMIPYFDDPKIMAVTPAIRIHKPKNIIQFMQKAEYNFGILGRHLMAKIDAIHVTPGPLSIFRKKVFDNLGEYKHAHNTEDMEIAFRMQENGYKIANCSNAFVYTVAPSTIRKLHVQRVRWMSGFLKNCLDYRHLFFKKKYGNMGVFTLPFSFISIFIALYVLGTILYNIGHYIIEKIIKMNTIGFNFSLPHFDWFFVNTESISILALVTIIFTIAFIFIGKKMAEGNIKLSRDIFYFILFYSFISPFWLTKAVYNTITSKVSPWR